MAKKPTSPEYLDAVLRRAREYLPPWLWDQIHRAALPAAGGAAAWRFPDVSPIEELALGSLEPDALGKADDKVITGAWSKLAGWYTQAQRRKKDTEPFARLGSYLLQEMRRRQLPVDDAHPLAKDAVLKCGLGFRLQDLPAAVTLLKGAVALARDGDHVGLIAEMGEVDPWPRVLLAMGQAGLPVEKSECASGDPADATPEGGVPIYDLALLRTADAPGTSAPVGDGLCIVVKSLALEDGCSDSGKIEKAAFDKSKCMVCKSNPPTVEVVWADGRGRAWFCGKCFPGWRDEGEPDGDAPGERDIVRQRLLTAGEVGEKFGATPGVRMRPGADLTAPPELQKAARNSGAMVAIPAPNEVREQLGKLGLLEMPGAEPDALHITLLYLGSADDIDSAKRKKIEQAVSGVVADHEQLQVKVAGFGKFNPGPDGVPAYAIVSGPGLSQLQADLERAVGAVIDLPSKHGWVPHMTLGYLPAGTGSRFPDLAEVKAPVWEADQVQVAWGDDHHAFFRLGETQKAQWTRAMINDLPDSAFLFIEGGGEKDEDGKTVPRSLRHFPVRGPDGDLDLPHLRNALARIPQSKISAAAKERATARGRKLLEAAKEQSMVKVLCSDDIKQVRYYQAMVPEEVDSHGHQMTLDEIEQAMWDYVAHSRQFKWEHGREMNSRIELYEGYLAPCDMTEFHGVKLEEPIAKGTGVVALHFIHRSDYDSAEGMGVSWGGYARKTVG